MRTFALITVVVLAACFIKPPPPDDGDGGLDGVEPNTAFVTSMAYPVSEITLAQGDQWCMEAAANGSRVPPGIYKAWLSTTSEPAQNRFGTARGWVRTDGKPFVDTIDSLITARRIFYPLRFDENGNDLLMTDPIGMVATATGVDGNASLFNCNDLGGAGEITFGLAHGAGETWTDHNTFSCSSAVFMHLYCFGTDRTSRADAPTSSGRRVFVTENAISVQSIGVTALDARCMTDAAAGTPPLTGEFRAVVPAAGMSALQRVGGTGSSWVRVDGVEVTTDFESLDAPINVTSKLHYLDYEFVWSGALDPSAVATMNCNDWTNTSSSVMTPVGFATTSTADAFGSATSSLPCSSFAVHLFCAER